MSPFSVYPASKPPAGRSLARPLGNSGTSGWFIVGRYRQLARRALLRVPAWMPFSPEGSHVGICWWNLGNSGSIQGSDNSAHADRETGSPHANTGGVFDGCDNEVDKHIAWQFHRGGGGGGGVDRRLKVGQPRVMLSPINYTNNGPTSRHTGFGAKTLYFSLPSRFSGDFCVGGGLIGYSLLSTSLAVLGT